MILSLMVVEVNSRVQEEESRLVVVVNELELQEVLVLMEVEMKVEERRRQMVVVVNELELLEVLQLRVMVMVGVVNELVEGERRWELMEVI